PRLLPLQPTLGGPLFRALEHRGRRCRLRSKFAADSLLEGDGFEPSVPRKVFWLSRRSPQFTFQSIMRIVLRELKAYVTFMIKGIKYKWNERCSQLWSMH